MYYQRSEFRPIWDGMWRLVKEIMVGLKNVTLVIQVGMACLPKFTKEWFQPVMELRGLREFCFGIVDEGENHKLPSDEKERRAELKRFGEEVVGRVVCGPREK